MSDSPRATCHPHEADWYVDIVIGQTFCPHGTTCTRKLCARQHGTETSSVDGWFMGERPTVADRDALVPKGWSRIESKVQRCRNKED